MEHFIQITKGAVAYYSTRDMAKFDFLRSKTPNFTLGFKLVFTNLVLHGYQGFIQRNVCRKFRFSTSALANVARKNFTAKLKIHSKN